MKSLLRVLKKILGKYSYDIITSEDNGFFIEEGFNDDADMYCYGKRKCFKIVIRRKENENNKEN